jgi:nucleosome binding factor SPN SPT16 subunit
MQMNNKIEVDLKKNVFWVPIFGSMVPFHLMVIKNISVQEEGRITSLRLNFNLPISANKISPNFPRDLKNPVYIKELTFRSANGRHYNDLLAQFKKMAKDFNIATMTMSSSLKDDVFIQTHGKKLVLDNVMLRPQISGRKNYGRLELHKNGFRFISKNGEELNILFSNVLHYVYLPPMGEELILIHFHLKEAMVVGNKKVKDLQFYNPLQQTADDLSGTMAVTLDKKNRRSKPAGDDDEEAFDLSRMKLEEAFKGFMQSVEKETNGLVKFEIPDKTKGFFGSFESVGGNFYPCERSLVSISTAPFVVVSIEEIDVVFFERVGMGLRTNNFDMAIIFKNFTKPVININSVSNKSKEELRSWFDSKDKIVLEGAMNLNWGKLLKRFITDLDQFVFEEDGWNAFASARELGGKDVIGRRRGVRVRGRRRVRRERSSFGLMQGSEDDSEYSSLVDEDEDSEEGEEDADGAAQVRSMTRTRRTPSWSRKCLRKPRNK